MRLTGKLLALTVVGGGVTVIVGFVVVVLVISWFSNPPFGLGNAPAQPIAFPHTVHAGTVEAGGAAIQCEFCHRNVAKGDAATVPAVEQCMFCHEQIAGENLVGATNVNLAEMAKVSQSFADGVPINWERVHRVPDHVRFVHEAHIRFFTQQDTSGLPTEQKVQAVCSKCHGDVAAMVEVKPMWFQSLKMGTCLDCHRQNNVPTDCTVCHK